MITKEQVRDIRLKLDATLADFGRQHGLSLSVGTLRYDATITGRLTILVLAPVGTSGPALTESEIARDFKAYAVRYGLKPEDLGRPLRLRSRLASLVGAKPRNTSYPIIVEGAQGGRWKVSANEVREALKRETPPAPAKATVARSEGEILEDFRRVEAALSPENLFCDGEITRAEALAKQRVLDARPEELVLELGREPGFEEMYEHAR